jgi:hypothetical protein
MVEGAKLLVVTGCASAASLKPASMTGIAMTESHKARR